MCGIFGVYNHPDAAKLTWLGLHALQHRGQETAGIVSSDGAQFCKQKNVMTTALAIPYSHLENLKGHLSIGHVRYSTSGESHLDNAQPITSYIAIDGERRQIAVAHNGNIDAPFPKELASEVFQTSIDSEVVSHLIAKSTSASVKEKVLSALTRLPPAYCFLIMVDDMLVATRDPKGYRPLTLAKMGDAYIVASETVAFHILENALDQKVEIIRDIAPGEVLFITSKGLESSYLPQLSPQKLQQCIFELVYFARPDSHVFGYNVSEVKELLGEQLAVDWPVDADVVMGVPDAANHAALGYSRVSKIPFRFGVVRNHYIERTFIQPNQNLRNVSAAMKFSADKAVVKDKKVVVVDDSVIRATNIKFITKILRNAGAKEVHVRITYPLWLSRCRWGIDTRTDAELMGSITSDPKEVAKIIGADSIQFLSNEGVFKALSRYREMHSDKKDANDPAQNFCYSCTLREPKGV